MTSRDAKVYFDIRVRLDGQETSGRVHGNEFVVGSGADVDLRVVHAALSEKHLQVRILPDGGLAVADLGSASGTKHSSQSLAPFKFYRYSPGRPLSVGLHELRIEIARVIEVPSELVAQAETTAQEIINAAERDAVEAQRRRSRAERKVRRLLRLETRLRGLLEQTEARRAEYTREGERLRELASKLADAEAAQRALDERKRTGEGEIEAQQRLLEELRGETTRLAKVRAERKQIEEEVLACEAEREEARVLLAASGRELREAEERRASLLMQIDHAWIEAEKGRGELEALREELGHLRREWEEKGAQCKQFRAEEERLTAQLPDLRELAQSAEEKSAELRRLTREVARLGTDEADRRTRVESLRADEEQASRHLERLVTESGDLRRQLEVSANQLRDCERQLLEARDEWKALTKALPAVREEIDEAREEGKRIRNETSAWVETQRADVERETQKRREDHQARLDRELGELRRREEHDLRESRRAFEDEVNSRVPEQKRLLLQTLKGLYLDHLSGQPVWGLKADEIRPRFLEAVEASLGPILEVETTPTPRRMRERWRRWGLAASVPMAALLVVLLVVGVSRGMRGSVGGFLSRHPASSELFNQRVFEERQKTRPYRPNQDDRFRPTYTENLIFLEGYLPLKLDPGLRVVWIKAVRRYCVDELNLAEVSVSDFLAKEDALLRELARLREEIRAEAAETDIAKMQQVEKESQKTFERILGGGVNIRKLKAFETDFYRKYSESLEQADAPNLR